jgi:anti-sigma factor RsiW
MTHDELAELIDLYVDGELPHALRENVRAYLAAHPEAAQEAADLQSTVAHLKAAPLPRPDDWFVERALDSLLREHRGAPLALKINETPRR